MHSVTVSILHALIMGAHAKALAATSSDDAHDVMDKLTDTLVDKMFSRVTSLAAPLGTAATPTTAGRPFLSSRPYFAGPPAAYQSGTSTRVQAAKDSLKMFGVGSSPLENLALTAIDVNNRRDVSANAKAALQSGWDLVEDKTKDRLLTVLDQVKAKDSLLAGISAPMDYFDPLGLSATTDAGKVLFYREVELKHGRVAMLAALGIVVGEQYHPLFGGNIDVPSYLAFQQTPLEKFWPAVVAAIAIPEIFSVQTFQDPDEGRLFGGLWKIKTDHTPGDLGFDPLGLKPKDPKELKTMQTKELNNGRLAMIAVAGMIAQEVATGKKLF